MDFEARGYRGDVAEIGALVALVRDASAEAGAPLQVLRGDRVWGREHVARAAALAARAFAAGRNRASELPLEFLSYAAGDRQISRALERLGLAPGRGLPVVAVAFGPRAAAALGALEERSGWARDDGVLEAPRGEAASEALEALGVDARLRSSVPPEAWGGLVLERVALVDLPKA